MNRIKTIILVFSLLSFIQIVNAQSDYDFYLQKARQSLAEGDCDGASRSYNVYKELSGGRNASLEEAIEECQKSNSEPEVINEVGNDAKKTFVTANFDYSFAPQASFGISAGQVKKYGWFVSVMTNGGFTGMGNLPQADANGFVDGGYLPMYDGETTTDRLSVIAGGIIRVADPLFVRVGAGYGARNLCWRDTSGQWYKMKDQSVQGLDFSVGLQFHLRVFVLSTETVTTNFHTLEGKLGFGYAF